VLNIVSVCVCILALVILHEIRTFLDSLLLSHMACWTLLYSSTLSHQWHDFLKMLLCVFWFSLQLLSETVLTIRRIQRDIIITVYWYSRKVSVISQILMKTQYSQKIFKISSNVKFNEKPSSGSRVVPHGQTDR
jgi:hypothetical protein